MNKQRFIQIIDEGIDRCKEFMVVKIVDVLMTNNLKDLSWFAY